MATPFDLYPLVRRMRGLPEGHRLIGPIFYSFGDGFIYGNGYGGGDGRMDFAYFQQVLEYGHGEHYGNEMGGSTQWGADT